MWFTPPYKRAHSKNQSGSVKDTKLLRSIQGIATRYITGGIKGTAFDVLEVHANTPPIDLLIKKEQRRAATRICALPTSHPLYTIARKAASRFLKTHRSPLHLLFFTTKINPKNIETIPAARRHPTYQPTTKTHIANNTDEALQEANRTHNATRYKVYCDGSGFEGGTGAAAILYRGNRIIKKLQLYIGPITEHTVYESELIGLLLALHLLSMLTCLIPNTAVIGLDNQAAIKAINNQEPKQASYLLDQIHNAAEHLQTRQDKILRKEEFRQARREGRTLKAKTRGVCDLRNTLGPGPPKLRTE